MPTTKHTPIDEFDLDIAQLGTPLTADALDALSDVIDARNAARDTLALLHHMQTMLESGAHAYRTREQFAVDLEQATDSLRRAMSAILGADGNA